MKHLGFFSEQDREKSLNSWSTFYRKDRRYITCLAKLDSVLEGDRIVGTILSMAR